MKTRSEGWLGRMLDVLRKSDDLKKVYFRGRGAMMEYARKHGVGAGLSSPGGLKYLLLLLSEEDIVYTDNCDECNRTALNLQVGTSGVDDAMAQVTIKYRIYSPLPD